MEFYFCDANLVIFWGKIKKYQGVFADSRRGGDEKTDGPCEPSVKRFNNNHYLL